ncbi:hypothetical protein QFZ53_002720 [Microbacterium natoriense]|uniref:Uncharacterized protein n=2 Tax=Microbacterium natoriense TaxID=284570 RepID=A0AAW8F0W8_9MICO|nr:hypothetical protein [Microbacterium natoriense]
MEQAFNGNDTFEGSDIARVLRVALDQITDSKPIVVDGGVSVAEGLIQVGLRPTLAINLVAPDITRARRLFERATTGNRVDDVESIHVARSIAQLSALERTIRELEALAPTLTIDGDMDVEDVLKSALSALLLAEIPVEDNKSSPSDRFLGFEHDVTSPRDICSLAPGPVLLIKPHLTGSGDLLRTVSRRFEEHGWGVAWEARHLTGSADVLLRAKAHFDIHYLYAAYASSLIGPKFVGGMEALAPDEYGTWEEGKVWKTEQGYWRNESRADGQVLVNGHMPNQIRSYEEPGNVVIAVGLYPTRPDRSGWGALRREVLGSSDPTKALPTSLRGEGARGKYSLQPFTLQKNGFHLSAGPLEAVRETLIWSRRPVSGALAYAVDQTPRGSGSWFRDSAGQDWGSKPVERVLRSAWRLSRRTRTSSRYVSLT